MEKEVFEDYKKKALEKMPSSIYFDCDKQRIDVRFGGNIAIGVGTTYKDFKDGPNGLPEAPIIGFSIMDNSMEIGALLAGKEIESDGIHPVGVVMSFPTLESIDVLIKSLEVMRTRYAAELENYLKEN